MKYFKNTELAKLYNVSEKSVRNWIDAAQAGKLDLQLHTENGKPYIANVAHNTLLIKTLVAKGKKYKNTRGFKVARPIQKFYDLYSRKQILDIISNLDIYREIPLQYTYFNSGARHWDEYTQSLLEQDAPNALTNTLNLLEVNLNYIDSILKEYDYVNIVDIGPGNGLPIRGVLEHFLDEGKLKRYIGIDISHDLMDIAQKNIKEWFGERVASEWHIRDISYERFDDLLAPETFAAESGSTLNLIFFLGGTINNFREPGHVLTTIHDSMGKDDILLASKKLDTDQARRSFEVAGSGNMLLVLKLLNIDQSFYVLEQYFDERKMSRELQARLNIALNIEFEMDGQKKVLELNKGDRILLWRAWHQTGIAVIDQFDANGFEILQATRSLDMDYLLLATKIKQIIRTTL